MAIGYNEAVKGNGTPNAKVKEVAQMIKWHVPNLPQRIADEIALKYVQSNKPIDREKIEDFVAASGY